MRVLRSDRPVLERLAAALLVVALSGALPAQAARRSTKAAPKSSAKASPGLVLGGEAYAEGHRLLEAGQVEDALGRFCEATVPAQAKGWSLSIALLCERSAVAPAVAELRRLRPEPVFVLFKLYKGAPCYRICLGLTADRNAAVAPIPSLPKEFKEHGPFPFPLRSTCDGDGVPPPNPPAGSEPSPTAPTSFTEAVIHEEHTPPHPTPAGENAVGAAPAGTGTAAAEPPALAPEPPAAAAVPEPPVGTAPAETPTAAPEPRPPTSETAPAPPGPAPGVESPATHAVPTTEAAPAPPTGSAAEAAEEWFQKGLMAQGRDQRDEARRCYEQSLLLQPDKAETLNNLAVLHLQAGRYPEARGLLERVLSARPGYGRAHLNLAGALWGLGEREAAVEEARRASSLSPGDTGPHLTLASFLKAMGRREEAQAEARVVLALEPGNAQARALLGEGAP